MAASAGNRSPAQSYSREEMTWYSEIQALSLLLAPHGRVHALIDTPPSERWQPFQLDAPESLPKSRFLGCRHLRDRGRKAEPPSIANFKPPSKSCFRHDTAGSQRAAGLAISNHPPGTPSQLAIRIHENSGRSRRTKKRSICQNAKSRTRQCGSDMSITPNPRSRM